MIDHLYNHDFFETFNGLARNRFSPLGVTYINVTEFVKQRKILNNDSFTDYVHACNPGPSAVPIMVVKRLLHIAALALKDWLPHSLHDSNLNTLNAI